MEVHVCSQWSLNWMNLKAPNFFALFSAGHLEQYMGTDSPFKCGIEICRHVRGKNRYAIERFQFTKQNIDCNVHFVFMRKVHPPRSPAGNGIRLIEKQNSFRIRRATKDGSNIFRGFAG